MTAVVRKQINWFDIVTTGTLVVLGTVIAALAVAVFQVPAQIAPGGVAGLSIVLNHLLGTPVGLVVLIVNIPIMLVAYRLLGGWHVIAMTILSVVVFSLAIDIITPFLPADGITDNDLLNALFGGIVGGIGTALVFRAGGTLGGTSVLGRILNNKFGIPMSTSSLYSDMAVIALAGLVFGWEPALLAIVALFVGGMMVDYVLEGPAVVRFAMIVTNHPHDVSHAILSLLQRGVTGWDGTGMFTGEKRTILYVTVGRAQVNQLRQVVLAADPSAFMVIGQGHTAYGHGFRANKAPRSQPLSADGANSQQPETHIHERETGE